MICATICVRGGDDDYCYVKYLHQLMIIFTHNLVIPTITITVIVSLLLSNYYCQSLHHLLVNQLETLLLFSSSNHYYQDNYNHTLIQHPFAPNQTIPQMIRFQSQISP